MHVCIYRYFLSLFVRGDSHHIPVYPQPPYQLPLHLLEATAADKILCVPNPTTLRINEVTIGISSLDSIAHLSNTEINQ